MTGAEHYKAAQALIARISADTSGFTRPPDYPWMSDLCERGARLHMDMARIAVTALEQSATALGTEPLAWQNERAAWLDAVAGTQNGVPW